MRLFNIIQDILFPPKCSFCRVDLKAGTRPLICNPCKNNLPIKNNICSKCQQPLSYHNGYLSCITCMSAGRSYNAAISAAYYDNTVRQAIIGLKFKNKQEYANSLAHLVADLVKKLGFLPGNIDGIVCIPRDKSRYNQRGFDPLELMAKKISADTSISIISNGLLRVRSTKRQSKLNSQERIKNVKGAFKANPKFNYNNKFIILFDDVFTTGATIMEASKALKRARCRYIIAITCAGSSHIRKI